MDKKINTLYEKLYDSAIDYIYYGSIKNCDEVLELRPQIQEFVEWFMNGNIFEIEDELYLEMCNDLIGILKDMMQAIENRDHVLLNDAITYGLMDYLKLFMDEGAYDENYI